MDEKTDLLICLGAATAANCVPCFDYYFRKASAAGITFEEVRKSVDLACKIKTGVSIVMKNSIMDITGQDWDSEKSGDGKTDYPCCK